MLRNVFRKAKPKEEALAGEILTESTATGLEEEPAEPVHLLPDLLYPSEPSNLKIAILGTCIAESLASAGRRCGHAADHYLMQSRSLEDEVPDVEWTRYDAVVVHLALRQISWQIAGRADLFHTMHITDQEYADALAVMNAQIERIISNINTAVGSTTPIFYLSFIEPIATHQGMLQNNRRKSLYHFVRTLNDDMATRLEQKSNAHFVEINDLVRYHGDAISSDAYKSHFMHAGIPDSQEAARVY